MKSKTVSSWVIRHRSSGDIILETFNKKMVDALNTKEYEAVPIYKYLTELNQSIKDSVNKC